MCIKHISLTKIILPKRVMTSSSIKVRLEQTNPLLRKEKIGISLKECQEKNPIKKF